MTVPSNELDIPGVYALQQSTFRDRRGSFTKLFSEGAFASVLPGFKIREAYLTVSQKGVLRGMHFQLPPHAHRKLVVCVGGNALDVILDLRPGPGYGRAVCLELTPDGTNCVAIPVGCAHGFYALEDGTSLMYFVETEYAPEHDAGILWNGFGFSWPEFGEGGPTISDRDTRHPVLDDFDSPTNWGSNL
ncbi:MULTISPECIES: dTDP-4-dehydrorhamnose 3,5-epimerase family protein [unclassified Marinovum]|uniref:dTDP-4-dehydrorhamnose 3,5-epimerase family protein n=1 Tax=unclassified Marinovum TaxID=2647166 RepID=UPI003EDC742C